MTYIEYLNVLKNTVKENRSLFVLWGTSILTTYVITSDKFLDVVIRGAVKSKSLQRNFQFDSITFSEAKGCMMCGRYYFSDLNIKKHSVYEVHVDEVSCTIPFTSFLLSYFRSKPLKISDVFLNNVNGKIYMKDAGISSSVLETPPAPYKEQKLNSYEDNLNRKSNHPTPSQVIVHHAEQDEGLLQFTHMVGVNVRLSLEFMAVSSSPSSTTTSISNQTVKESVEETKVLEEMKGRNVNDVRMSNDEIQEQKIDLNLEEVVIDHLPSVNLENLFYHTRLMRYGTINTYPFRFTLKQNQWALLTLLFPESGMEKQFAFDRIHHSDEIQQKFFDILRNDVKGLK